MKKATALFNKLERSYNSYMSAIGAMESELVNHCEFEDDFSILYQPGDGFVIEHDSNNASLDDCLEIIKEKGYLSIEDYLDLTI